MITTTREAQAARELARPMEPRGYDVPCDYNQCPHFARFLVDERGAGDPAQVCEHHA